jgi:hypothetical protein
MLQSAPKSFRDNKSSLPARKSVFDSIDAQKIGEGKYFREGKFGHKRNAGLKGQLSKIKRTGKLAAKNLSKKNLNDIYGMISGRLKKHNRGYGAHINRKDKVGIMRDAEKLVRTKGSKFSREDKADLKKIVNSLENQSSKNILKKRNNFEQAELHNPKENISETSLNKKVNLNSSIQSLNNINNSQQKEQKDITEEIEPESEEDLNIPIPNISQNQPDEEIEESENQVEEMVI